MTKQMVCRNCHKSLSDQNLYYTSISQDGITTYSCYRCEMFRMMEQYYRSKEITSTLLLKAASAELRFTGEIPYSASNQEYRDFLTCYETELKEIVASLADIKAAVSSFCNKHLGHIRSYYASSQKRGHQAIADGFEALLWGSAGRVLLTFQDRERHGRYNGAVLTLIFAEDSTSNEAGIQSICATKEEALALLRDATEAMPEFQSNDNVTVA